MADEQPLQAQCRLRATEPSAKEAVQPVAPFHSVTGWII